MKGSLQELVTESAETDVLAQARMSCHARQIADLESSGVSKRRIEALYPFDLKDYEQGIASALPRLLIQWANGTNTLLPELENFKLQDLYAYLPDSIVNSAHEHYDDRVPAEFKLKVLLHLCHALATYDTSAEVLAGESETDAENAWSDALHFMQPANDLLSAITYAAR